VPQPRAVYSIFPIDPRTYRVLRSDPNGLFFDHKSPHGAEFGGEMRAVFWTPLDRLVDRARAS
jgi:hypothetical protein